MGWLFAVSATYVLSCRKDICDFESSDSASRDMVKLSQELLGDALWSQLSSLWRVIPWHRGCLLLWKGSKDGQAVTANQPSGKQIPVFLCGARQGNIFWGGESALTFWILWWVLCGKTVIGFCVRLWDVFAIKAPCLHFTEHGKWCWASLTLLLLG